MRRETDSNRIVRAMCFFAGFAVFLCGLLAGVLPVQAAETSGNREVTLRICSWEEYIDEGDWGEDEAIDLPDGTIIGVNPMIEDFEQWYEDTYGVKVNVEYSTFGTNEDLYNMLTLGDTYDLVCPSEYMFMKLMSENELVPLSEGFFDENNGNNYYILGVSPYLRSVFDSHEVNGEPWSRYAAGFMWGVTGIVYNPDMVTEEEASTWSILTNPAFRKRITIKDSVRECYFAAVGALDHDTLVDPAFIQSPDYREQLELLMNDTSEEKVREVQDWLQDMKDNVYSFEVDSGKADMVTGKVAANYQWSGDAVYTMDQAEEDGYYLNFAIPEEVSNIYFDGWVMLKRGIGDDAARQQAAEAFINFVSRPDNAIRNMNYIGYTSFISGGEDPRILEYLKWNYEEDDGTEEPADSGDTGTAESDSGNDADRQVQYDLTYFFTGDENRTDPQYVLTVPEEQTKRQLGAQYPSKESIRRTSIMQYFNPEQSERINSMWVNVRCYNITKMPAWGWILLAAAAAGIVRMVVMKGKRKHRNPAASSERTLQTREQADLRWPRR